MGNQARVATDATVVSTSTRNFPNRLGKNTSVYLASAELAAVTSIMGKLPTVEEYLGYTKAVKESEADVYEYLRFDKMEHFVDAANREDKYSKLHHH